MKTMRLTLTGAAAAAALLACPVQSEASAVHVGIVISTGGHYRDHGPRYDAYRLGYDRGSQDGWRRGYEDGRRNRHFGYADDHGYRCADAGYSGRYGSRSRYTSGYRHGYEESYRRAFNQGRRQSRGHDRYDRYDQRDHDWR